MAIQEKQLGQLRPGDTTAASLYSPGASTTGIVSSVVISNVGTVSANYRLFVDDNGTTYDETSSLAWDVSLPANTTDVWTEKITMNDATGNLAVRTDIASALNFTAFGIEIT